MPSAETDHLVLERVLTPYRSLSRRGAAWVIGSIVFFTALLCLRFWLIGAWPVMIFSLIDLPLIAGLLALNFHRARQNECLLLTDRTLTIVRTDTYGRRSQKAISTAWMRVALQDDGGVSRVIVQARGSDCEVGAFLHEPDRLALFRALHDALHDINNPQFDNPQLRDT
jgi:uncharacterized membrane protein